MTYKAGFFTPFLVLAAAFAMPACFLGAGDEEPPAPLPTLERTDGCAMTACDVERDECHQDIEECNDTCIRGSIESFSACYAVCRSLDCPICSGESRCVERSFRFSVTGASDPVVEEACQDAVSRDQRCAEAQVNPDCRLAGKVERPEAAASYRCVAKLNCGADTAGCFAMLPEESFGSRVCRNIAHACPSTPCGPDDEAALDEFGRWYRDDVLETGMMCFDERCDDALACLDAWIGTLLGRAD